jgi:hypothetical protein
LALIGTIAQVFFLMEPNGGVAGCVFFWSSAICVGVLWRTHKDKIWNRTALAYVGVNAIVLLYAIVTADALGRAAVSFVIAIACMALILSTYAIRVRWWNRIGLGWTGGQIG